MYYRMRYTPEAATAKATAKPSHRLAGKHAPRQKPRSSQPRAFDPDELTRRLTVVLTEQKAQADKKRRARAEAEKKAKPVPVREDSHNISSGQKPSSLPKTVKLSRSLLASRPKTRDGAEVEETSREKLYRSASKSSTGSSTRDRSDDGYHHVPQVAASQFALTTTVEVPNNINLVHKLSRKAMKFHMDGPNASKDMAATADAAPCEQAKALRRAQSNRERQYERNQFQHMPTLSTTAEVDERRIKQSHRHTIQPHVFEAMLRADSTKQQRAARRMSTGSALVKGDPHRRSFEMPGAQHAPDMHHDCELCELAPVITSEHRVDWTQSDEIPPPKQKTPPPLRKPDSRWTLRGRLGSFNKHGKDEKPPSPIDEKGVLVESPKSPRAGFFARFKR